MSEAGRWQHEKRVAELRDQERGLVLMEKMRAGKVFWLQADGSLQVVLFHGMRTAGFVEYNEDEYYRSHEDSYDAYQQPPGYNAESIKLNDVPLELEVAKQLVLEATGLELSDD
jgi:hypothetical protein